MENDRGIYLEETDILRWERPPREGYSSFLHIFNGSTKLLSQVGFDKVDEDVGSYKILASASKYSADLIRINEEDPFCRPRDKFPQRVILFSGALTVYKKGVISDNGVEGYGLERNGRIWVAKTPHEAYKSSEGLQSLLFGYKPNQEQKLNAIERILLGYQNQEKEARAKKRFEESLRRN